MISLANPQGEPPTLMSVQVGRIAPLGAKRVPSGFVKRPVTGPVHVGKLNLDGDAQADLTVHGGPEKAVYAYAASRYPEWSADFPEHAAHFTPGAFGENLTMAGMSENDICVGDIHAIGSTRLQVCQPRQPCYKFALRFDDNRMPPAMVRTGRAGWYYRVLSEGVLQAGDAVSLVERPNPDLPFNRLIAIVNRSQATDDELHKLADADGLASWLRIEARRAAGSRRETRGPNLGDAWGRGRSRSPAGE